MPALNSNHKRFVAAALGEVDERLRAVEHLAQGEFSAFEDIVADLTPEETALLLALAAQLRERLLTTMDSLELPRLEPKISARWSAHTALEFGEIDLLEISVERLRGYGTMEIEAAAEVSRLVGELRSLLSRARRNLLPEGSRRDDIKLASLSGVPAELLKGIAAIVADQKLMEVRPLLGAAVQRAEMSTVDVGIFGRTSAGKSSLINALLNENFLPVDAVPATAVPVRVKSGTVDTADVHFVNGDAHRVARSDLPAYASEDANPGNRRGVWIIEATAPGVPCGLRIMDTPGIGSLALSTSSQAIAWALRCEAALVLVAASSALTREDIMLIEALHRGGARCRLLVSKTDLLDKAARARSLDYIRRELERALGPEHGISVTSVSALPNVDAGLDLVRVWLDELIEPDVETAARLVFKSRFHKLMTATEAALAARRVLTQDLRHVLDKLASRIDSLKN